MDVLWVTAFLDRPGESFDETIAFWQRVCGATLSPWRGVHNEFATLLPDDGGDPHLRVQRTAGHVAGSHIDLHVADVRRGIDECLGLGARLVADHETFAVLASPGSVDFCVVRHHGERTRQAPVSVGGTKWLVDQVSIDVDPEGFDRETRFWCSITGWPTVASSAPQFQPLERPSSIPLRLMLQRRDRSVGATSCHLDIACEDVQASVAEHCSAGATVVSTHRFWSVMSDPSGSEYCLTARLPSTGRLPPG